MPFNREDSGAFARNRQRDDRGTSTPVLPNPVGRPAPTPVTEHAAYARLVRRRVGGNGRPRFNLMRYLHTALLTVLLLGSTVRTVVAAQNRAAAEPVVLFDQTPLFALDLKDEAQRRRFWDETHLAVSLQGLVNRTEPRLFIRYLKEPDDFWWQQMTQPGGWLAERPIVRVTTITELLVRFREFCRGVVVWDERVPSTSNLASTIAGCDDLLALRYDERDGSLYRSLTQGPVALPVQVRLLCEDGSPLFTGAGQIPDTMLPSTGSAKCDSYRWLIEHYVKTGKANPQRMGYYLDAFWLKRWQAAEPENHTLSNHDFVIARRGVLFDLNVWDDEPCVDDPGQEPGTDVETLKQLLRAAYDRFAGNGVIHVAGFVPWAYKYTKHERAGGTHDAVPTEWRYAEILSCFNAFMDADALGLGAMANASFYQHFPLAARYLQNPKPTRASLQAAGLLDAQGRIAPRCWVAHYVGDYDSAAWLYRMLPKVWRDPARGHTPLSWAFNPNLCERFPLGMAWARERRTTNDWFVAGDSGAGYLNPGNLTPPRAHSGLPSGLAAWERHCQRLYDQWDISLTGFVIDGYAPGLSLAGLDAYARFSPDGIVAQQIPRQGVHSRMPFLRMKTDLEGSPAAVARTIQGFSQGTGPRFVVCRSILQTPTWYAQIEQELAKLSGDQVKVVDLYTLLWLVREFETNAVARPVSPYAAATELSAHPNVSQGLATLSGGDGEFAVVAENGSNCWHVAKHEPPRYLYFDVDDAFKVPPGNEVEIELDYLDAGTGRIVLEYDATDSRATHSGAYKAHPRVISRSASGAWRKAVFRVADAKFGGRQNGDADFRFFNGGDDLLVRAVTVRRSAQNPPASR